MKFAPTWRNYYWNSLARWIAYRLPRDVVRWASIRLMTHAKISKYGNRDGPELTTIEALKRWD